MPLSDVAIRKARPADKPLRLFDGGGLYLEISPTGSKLWRWKYRFAGKEKRLALGVYPETSLAEARASHAAARKLLSSGVDPGVQRKVEKLVKREGGGNTFGAIALEMLNLRSKKNAKSTVVRNRRIIEKDLIPYFGDRPIVGDLAPLPQTPG